MMMCFVRGHMDTPLSGYYKGPPERVGKGTSSVSRRGAGARLFPSV